MYTVYDYIRIYQHNLNHEDSVNKIQETPYQVILIVFTITVAAGFGGWITMVAVVFILIIAFLSSLSR